VSLFEQVRGAWPGSDDFPQAGFRFFQLHGGQAARVSRPHDGGFDFANFVIAEQKMSKDCILIQTSIFPMQKRR
jgi:hypothetical protein